MGLWRALVKSLVGALMVLATVAATKSPAPSDPALVVVAEGRFKLAPATGLETFRVIAIAGEPRVLEVTRGDVACRYTLDEFAENKLAQKRRMEFAGARAGDCRLDLDLRVIGFLSPDRHDAPGYIRFGEGAARVDVDVAEVRIP